MTAIAPRRTSHDPRVSARGHRPIATAAALVAVSAYGGALALGTGAAALGDTLDARLPFASPVLGAVALVCLVAIPSTILAAFAADGNAETATYAIGVGALLVGWIAIELAFLRAFSWFQPVYVAIGMAFIAAGLHARRAGRLRAAVSDRQRSRNDAGR